MANPNPVMKFSSEYQPAGRGLSYRNRLIEALKRCGLGEEEFLDAFIRTSIRMTEENPTQGVQMLKEIFLRISPVQKSMAPPVNFKYRKDATPVEQIEDVIQSVSAHPLYHLPLVSVYPTTKQYDTCKLSWSYRYVKLYQWRMMWNGPSCKK